MRFEFAMMKARRASTNRLRRTDASIGASQAAREHELREVIAR